MNFSVGIMIDIIIVVIVLIVAIRYYKKGFVSGIVNFVGTLAALIAAFMVSKQFSGKLFENFLKDNFIEKTSSMLGSNTDLLTVEEVIQNVTGFLPQGIVDFILGATEINIDGNSAVTLSVQIVEEVIAPLVIPVISMILFFVAFALFRLFIMFLSAALINVNKIPLVGSANRMLGFFSGILVGVLYIYVLIIIIWGITVVTSNELTYLNQEILSSSKIYNVFEGYMPF